MAHSDTSVPAPRYAVNVYSTPHNTLVQDIEQIARTGGTGIGISERKLDACGVSDDEVRALLAQHGLKVTVAVPRMWSLLPGHKLFSHETGESDPMDRARTIAESFPRMGAFGADTVMVAIGASGDPAKPAGPVTERVVQALGHTADVAAEHGLQIAFELLGERRGAAIPTIPAMVEVMQRTARPNIGVFFDIFHSWCEPDLHEHLRTYADLINGVHVNDVKVNERAGTDREMPGRGRGVAPEIIATLIEAGWDGWWETEVFSDDGTYLADFPDSYWKLPHEQFLAECKRAFDETWEQAMSIVAERRASTPAV